MKRNFKRRFMTGVAAIALVAPLVLGGLNNNVHAANTSAAAHEENMIHNGSLKNGTVGASNPTASNSTSNPNAGANAGNNTSSNQSSNSSQLNAIKAQIQAQESIMQNNLTQARTKYQKLPKAQQKAQLKSMDAALEKQQKPVQQKIEALQKKYQNTMTPQQRKQAKEQQQAQQKKLMKQIQAQMKAQEKKEQAKMLKTAQTIFVIQGNKAYTLRTDVTKNKQGQEQLQPIPGINKKYYSTKKAFGQKQLKEVRKAQAMATSAKKLRNKTARKNAMQKANNLFMQYARVAQMPTKKQQQAEAKKAAKQQKKSQRKSKTSRKTNRKARTHKKAKRTRRSKQISKDQSNRARKGQRKSKTFKKNGVTVLRSEYRRGSNRKAKAAGFVNGYAYPDGIHTIFNHYQPDSKRAVIPRNLHIYKVNPKHITKNGNATTWLVGRRTKSEKRISNMKQAYYYNTNYRGWLNIGKK